MVWPRNKLGDPVCIAHDPENSVVDLVQFVLWPQNLPVEARAITACSYAPVDHRHHAGKGFGAVRALIAS